MAQKENDRDFGNILSGAVKKDSRVFNIFKELGTYPDKLNLFHRMNQETFIEKKDTIYRPSIPAEERILITLRLALFVTNLQLGK